MKTFTEWAEQKLREAASTVREVEFLKQIPAATGWSMQFRIPGTRSLGVTSPILSAQAIDPNTLVSPVLQQQAMGSQGQSLAAMVQTSNSMYRTVMPKQALFVMRKQTSMPQTGMAQAQNY